MNNQIYTDPMNSRLVILGAGESGVGAALLGKAKGYDVFVSDAGKIKAPYRKELESAGIEFEEGRHSEDRILSADLVVKSPGIPDKVRLVQSIREKLIPVVSEIEFAYHFLKGKIIAITGSNGKTTTTSLIYHIMHKAGMDVALAGNIGNSLARTITEKQYDYYVVEISSFQLDDVESFHPHISVITNITEDHLDRYDHKFENYIQSKLSVTKNQDENDYCIYCLDDEVSRKYIHQVENTACIPFSWEQSVAEGAFIEGDNIIYSIKKKLFTMPMREFALAGRHNYFNAMAAGIATRVLGVRKDVIRESLQDFKNLEHRMEFVLTVRGIDFINDSKATNVNSAWFAMESMNKDVIWIAGGKDKGNDYAELRELVKDKVKAIICLGIDNDKLHNVFASEVGYIVDTNSMTEAVNMAYNLAGKDEVVLLSPACASFDLFENYEDRGNQFKRAVRSL